MTQPLYHLRRNTRVPLQAQNQSKPRVIQDEATRGQRERVLTARTGHRLWQPRASATVAYQLEVVVRELRCTFVPVVRRRPAACLGSVLLYLVPKVCDRHERTPSQRLDSSHGGHGVSSRVSSRWERTGSSIKQAMPVVVTQAQRSRGWEASVPPDGI